MSMQASAAITWPNWCAALPEVRLQGESTQPVLFPPPVAGAEAKVHVYPPVTLYNEYTLTKRLEMCAGTIR